MYLDHRPKVRELSHANVQRCVR